MSFNNKNVAVVGLGISNIPLIRYLLKHGAAVSGRDRKSAAELGERFNTLANLGVECILGKNYLANLDQYDAVFLTPGIPKHLPEIEALKDKGLIDSETALVLRKAQPSIIGITGSSGKTTTTTLVGEMLKSSGIKCHVGGNIGMPLIEQIDDIPADEPIVLELSSFQLELLDLSPQLALVTNISENHLDVHLTMENYIRAKEQIFLSQKQDDIAIFNYDDPVTKQMESKAIGKSYYFSTKSELTRGIYLDSSGKLVFQDQGEKIWLLSSEEIGLFGEHNLQNIMAAALLAHLAGADWEAICQVAREFRGVKHRLEHIATINGVDYFNDSIATSPARTIAGISAFSRPVILIAGGYDKKLSFKELATTISSRVKTVILLGETADLIQSEIAQVAPQHDVYRVNDLAAAVELGGKLASSGDIVLLSPACASFDLYPNFEERGDHFRSLVKDLASGRD